MDARALSERLNAAFHLNGRASSSSSESVAVDAKQSYHRPEEEEEEEESPPPCVSFFDWDSDSDSEIPTSSPITAFASTKRWRPDKRNTHQTHRHAIPAAVDGASSSSSSKTAKLLHRLSTGIFPTSYSAPGTTSSATTTTSPTPNRAKRDRGSKALRRRITSV